MVCAGTSPGVLGSLLELVVNFQRAVVQKLVKSSQHNKQQEVKQEKQALHWIYELFDSVKTFQHRVSKVIWTPSLLTYEQQWRLISQQLPNPLLLL